MATHFRSVEGITEGLVHHAAGEVFVGSKEVNAHFERTGGKTDDGRVLYVKASKSDYTAYLATLEAAEPEAEAPAEEPGEAEAPAEEPGEAEATDDGEAEATDE